MSDRNLIVGFVLVVMVMVGIMVYEDRKGTAVVRQEEPDRAEFTVTRWGENVIECRENTESVFQIRGDGVILKYGVEISEPDAEFAKKMKLFLYPLAGRGGG